MHVQSLCPGSAWIRSGCTKTHVCMQNWTGLCACTGETVSRSTFNEMRGFQACSCVHLQWPVPSAERLRQCAFVTACKQRRPKICISSICKPVAVCGSMCAGRDASQCTDQTMFVLVLQLCCTSREGVHVLIGLLAQVAVCAENCIGVCMARACACSSGHVCECETVVRNMCIASHQNLMHMYDHVTHTPKWPLSLCQTLPSRA